MTSPKEGENDRIFNGGNKYSNNKEDVKEEAFLRQNARQPKKEAWKRKFRLHLIRISLFYQVLDFSVREQTWDKQHLELLQMIVSLK